MAVRCLEGVPLLNELVVGGLNVSSKGLLYSDDLPLVLPYFPVIEAPHRMTGQIIPVTNCNGVFIHGTLEVFDAFDDEEDGDVDEDDEDFSGKLEPDK
jgi:hypothetical protein